MDIGIPKEVKTAERRVALTPEACKTLVDAGHHVSIEKGAGIYAGFSDEQYTQRGVVIQSDAQQLYANSQMIVKVKEPQEEEYRLLRKEHLLFCYLHLASSQPLIEALKEIGLTGVAFETVEENGTTPLLAPMSAIAGRLSVQLGAHFLHAPEGGRGVLIGGTSDHQAGRVAVIGIGIAGTEAACIAYGMGAHVTVLDIDKNRLEQIKNRFPEITTLESTPQTLEQILPETDLLIGAVYVTGKRAPHVVSEEQVLRLPQGAVVVDIAIDQGGCVETSRPCTYDDPSYSHKGIIHSAITNLPAAVPITASSALSEAIVPYVHQLAQGNWTDALRKGINVQEGQLKIEL